jgi:hypothetical protein
MKIKKTKNEWAEYLKKEELKKAINTIIPEEDIEDYDAIALRWDDREFKIGEEIPVSKVWVDGDETDDYLEGTSTIGLQTYDDGWIAGAKVSLMSYRNYPNIYLVAGDIAELGEDDGELVLSNCEVLAKLDVI